MEDGTHHSIVPILTTGVPTGPVADTMVDIATIWAATMHTSMDTAWAIIPVAMDSTADAWARETLQSTRLQVLPAVMA